MSRRRSLRICGDAVGSLRARLVRRDSRAMSIDRPIGQPVLVKRYASRRLYNVESTRYVTRDDLAAMLRHGQRFVVREAESGEDVTSQIVDALNATLH